MKKGKSRNRWSNETEEDLNLSLPHTTSILAHEEPMYILIISTVTMGGRKEERKIT